MIQVPMSNSVLVSWCAMQVFQRTVCRGDGMREADDESNQHVLFTMESEHPYPPRNRKTGKIYVPGAESLRISFDKRSCINASDTFCLYGNEDFSKQIKKYS
jgi:hypothetical protein